MPVWQATFAPLTWRLTVRRNVLRTVRPAVALIAARRPLACGPGRKFRCAKRGWLSVPTRRRLLACVMNSGLRGEAAALPSGRGGAPDARDRTYYVRQHTKPDAALDQLPGQSLAIQTVVLIRLVWRVRPSSYPRNWCIEIASQPAALKKVSVAAGCRISDRTGD